MSAPDIIHLVARIDPVGSRITCNPPVTNTDEDFLILVREEKWEPLKSHLFSEGWVLDGSEVSDAVNHLTKDERFNSFSCNGVNLIATRSEEFHKRFLAATSVVKKFNLLEKPDRIILFQAVLYGHRYVEDDICAFGDNHPF